MSRSTKLIVSVSLLMAAALAGWWAWFLHGRPQAQWEMWSSVLAGFAVFLALPGLVAGVVALRAPSSRDGRSAGTSMGVRIGKIRSGRDTTIDVRQDGAGQ